MRSPDEYFAKRYEHTEVYYGRMPRVMALGAALKLERMARGDEVVDAANREKPWERAAQHVRLLHEVGALLPEDEHLVDKFSIQGESTEG